MIEVIEMVEPIGPDGKTGCKIDSIRSAHDREFRLKRIAISAEDVLSCCLGNQEHLPAFISFIVGEGLPEKFKVAAVHYSSWRRMFEFTIEHHSFGPVVPGHEIPELHGPFGIKRKMIPIREGEMHL